MPCNQKIFQAIENDCTPVKGIAPIAKWAFRSDIAFTFVDNTITAIATPTLPLGLFKSFKFGLNAGHEVKTFENYPDRFTHKFMGISSEATDALDAIDDIVVFVQPNIGTTWKVYGAKNGLWKTSQSFMTNDNMGATAFEFASREGLEEIYECYNTSIDISALVDMDSFDLIYGGKIANLSNVHLYIDTNKTGYVKLPNNNILTTVSGEIDTAYNGISGDILFYVPKNTADVAIRNSGVTGNLTSHININGFDFENVGITSFYLPNQQSIYAPDCELLTTIIAPKAKVVVFINCALTAKSIGDILYYAYKENREDVNYNFSGGTNANQTAIAAYMLSTYGLVLNNVLGGLTSGLGGVIVLNA